MNKQTEGIEKFPHVVSKLATVWGTGSFESVINDYTMDRTRGNRQGFTEDSFRDLVELKDLHQLIYPECIIKQDPWDIKGTGLSK